MGRLFANVVEDLGSILSRIIPKTFKMVLDTSLLNTQQYKVRVKGKVEQSRERSSTLLYFGVVAIEKGAFWSSSTTVTNITFLYNKVASLSECYIFKAIIFILIIFRFFYCII